MNAAGDHPDRLPKLAVWQVALMRRGVIRIDGHSRRSPLPDGPSLIEDGVPDRYLGFRLDLDFARHSDKKAVLTVEERQEVADLAAAINTEVFQRPLHTEASPHGMAGYGVLGLEFFPGFGYTSTKRCGEHIRRLQRLLRQFAAAKGFKATVEVQGDPSIIGHDENGTKFIVRRGHPMRMPTCPQPGDVDRLEGAVFDLGVIDEIERVVAGMAPAPIQTAPDAAPASPITTSAPVQPKVKKPKRSRTPRRRVITEFGEGKHQDRLRCMSAAISAVLPADRRGVELTDDERTACIDAADGIYEASGLASGERDADRDQAWGGILDFMQSTHDSAKMGKGGDLFFGEADDAAADAIIAKHFSDRALENAQKSNPNIHGRITPKAMRITLETITKNTFVPSGQNYKRLATTSTKAVMGMLRHHGISINGSGVSVMIHLLLGRGQVRQMSDASPESGCSRQLVPGSEEVWNLPFVAGHTCQWRQDQEIERAERAITAAAIKAARDAFEAGGRGASPYIQAILLSTNKKEKLYWVQHLSDSVVTIESDSMAEPDSACFDENSDFETEEVTC